MYTKIRNSYFKVDFMKKFILFATIFLVAVIITGCKDPEPTEPSHEHTFADSWSKNATHHWKVATCEHTEEVSKFAEHSFGEYVSNNDATTESDGTKTRVCSVCGYEDTITDEGSKIHEHTFATKWTYDGAYHWKAATCEHIEEVSEKAAHTFGEWTTTKEPTEQAVGSKERVCTVCNYKEIAEIAQLAHTHKFATEWTSDATNHWYASTCGHEVVDGEAAHTFGDWTTTKEPTEAAVGSKEQVCSVCNYKKTAEIEKIPTGFVLIKAGTFKMGSNEVTITKNFYMSKYEVTQGEYEDYCSYGGSSPSSTKGDGNNYPAYFVSWYDALVYCNKRSIAENLTPCYSMNEETDPTKWGTVPTSSDSTWNGVVCNWGANGYRLPTEAEWEYAARAGDNTVDTLIYSGTNDVNKLGEYAWYSSNSSSKTHEVGTKKANAFGLYEMRGNVFEWCWNWKTSSYDTNTEGGSDPTGALSGSDRVLRGGSWTNNSDSCSVYNRNGNIPEKQANTIGFRVVRASSN